ncbi:secretion protein EccK [Mycobacterium hubeiense]|uniref:secretion protein EccK n=1 Tax=Mycobacterium hubeiense TaxID=1867256 RepID=UPI0011591D64|nr:secretion protein EccK [Mycobacterium sp. QGD 101]
MPSSPLSDLFSQTSDAPAGLDPTQAAGPPTGAAPPQTPVQAFAEGFADAANAAGSAPIQPASGAVLPPTPVEPVAPPPATGASTPASTTGAASGAAAPTGAPPVSGAMPGGMSGGPAAPPPMPLGPPPTPPPAAPSAPAGPAAPLPPAATGSAAAGAMAAPAPVPVSAARAERDAAASALRRSGTDPLEIARRIAAALNVGGSGGRKDPLFMWLTGLTKDGSIVVANNYGLGYIPDGVNLPEQVRFASADESIPVQERATWATYPILALQGWAQAHDTKLRAVIAMEEHLEGFDPGTATIVLQPDDLPNDGRMQGRSRLEVIAPDAAAKLAALSDAALPEQLPPAPVDPQAPEDRQLKLLKEVFRPLLASDPGRVALQLQAMVAYATHMEELALYRAHTAADAAAQRAAIADWIYWQHVAVLTSDAVGVS